MSSRKALSALERCWRGARPFGPPLAHDSPGTASEQQHAIADAQGFVDIVGDQQCRALVLMHQVHQQVLHRLAGDRVERRKGFVEIDDLGVARQRPRQRGALRHAAGQRVRALVTMLGKSHLFERATHPLRSRLGRLPLTAAKIETKTDVLRDAQPGQQGRRLKNDAGRRRARGAGLPVQRDLAGLRLGEARQNAQQRRLAAARTANQTDDLTPRNGQLDVGKNRVTAVRETQLTCVQQFTVAIGQRHRSAPRGRLPAIGGQFRIELGLRQRIG